MTKKAGSQRKAKDQSRRPDPEQGKLKDSLGAWKMSDAEEERIFSGLNKNWKKWNKLTTADLAGSGRKHASASEMKRLLDRLRAEEMIKAIPSESMSDGQNVDELVKSLLKLKKTGKEPLVLRLSKTATAIVASGRDHWHTWTPVYSS